MNIPTRVSRGVPKLTGCTSGRDMKYGDAPERAQGQKSGLSPRLVILFLRVSDVSALNDVFSVSVCVCFFCVFFFFFFVVCMIGRWHVVVHLYPIMGEHG